MKRSIVTTLSYAGVLATLGLMACSSPAAAQTITGDWQFNGDFTGDVGSALTATGTWSFQSVTINGQTGQAARFTQFQNTAKDAYLNVIDGIKPNGGGSFVNKYSIIMDVKFDALPSFISLYQTAANPTANDGDWYIRNDGGMGISGQYTTAGNNLRFKANTWQRIALVIDTTSPTGPNAVYQSYINGQLQNVVQNPSGWGKDGRFSLNPNFYLFADSDAETESGYIKNLQVRDYAMSAAEIAALGGPSIFGIRPSAVPAPGALLTALLGVTPGGVLVLRRRLRKC
jgi:hypothetical protein